MATKSLAHFSPGRIIFCALFFTIIIGTLLLALPFARTQPASLFDLFFTATSVTCVTGLTTIPFDIFTPFGQGVLLLLMQIGGLGLITLTIFLLSLFVNLGFTTQLMAVKLLELESWHNIKKLLLFIIGITLFFELLGTVLLLPVFMQHYSGSSALFMAFFHAVSSFCNAGVMLNPTGMQPYVHHYWMQLITAALIIAGGLGFITWRELARYFNARRLHKRYHLSLNTKIILYSTFVLLCSTTLLILALEYRHAFAGMHIVDACMNAFFSAASARSAGLLTVHLSALHILTCIILLMNAFIGAGPASTASGIKLTTMAVFFATIKSALFGKTSVELRGRSIAIDQVYKAIAIISLSCLWIAVTTCILLWTDATFSFFDLFFENVSAFTTLGFSTGITPQLSLIGKIIIMLDMIVGRIGSLTLILALIQLRSQRTHTEFSYPEERVLLG